MTGLARPALATAIGERERWIDLADAFAIGVAVSLPWSTSLMSILIAAWLFALLSALRPAEALRELAHPAVGLPVALWALAIIGALWSPASVGEQISALKGFHKLLVLPLLFIHFRRSGRGAWVLGGFLASSTALLALSWFLHVWPHDAWRVGPPGVPVKDYIVQSGEFLICAFAFAHLAIHGCNERQHGAAAVFALLALLFVGNMAFVATGRTSLTAFFALLVLFALQRFGGKGTLAVAAGGVVFAAMMWAASPYLRQRTLGVLDEVQRYREAHAETSSGYRLEFWKKSIGFVAEAPIRGHGTGSIQVLFRQAATGDTGIAAAVTGNPHNQTLEIAAQFGLIGVALLYAIWIAHFLMFGAAGPAGWVGQALVLQAVVGSLFLSYMLDFSSGWLYVLGVGVLGGTVTRRSAEQET